MTGQRADGAAASATGAAPAPRGSLRRALAALAPLFSYPGADFAARLATAREAVGATACPQALASLDRFARRAETVDANEREEIYSATFDLSPSCPPYLGVHLFEAESPERARLMVGLRRAAAQAGRQSGSELPDHLAEVLAGADAFSQEEWLDLARLCLVPALARMAERLDPVGNPYHHLLATGHRLAAAVAETGETS